MPLSERMLGSNNSAFVLTVGGVAGSSVVIAANSGAIIQCNATQCFVFGGGANVTRNLGELQAQFVLGTVVTQTAHSISVYKNALRGHHRLAQSILRLRHFHLAIQINGTPVTGLSAVAVTSTPYTTAATARQHLRRGRDDLGRHRAGDGRANERGAQPQRCMVVKDPAHGSRRIHPLFEIGPPSSAKRRSISRPTPS